MPCLERVDQAMDVRLDDGRSFKAGMELDRAVLPAHWRAIPAPLIERAIWLALLVVLHVFVTSGIARAASPQMSLAMSDGTPLQLTPAPAQGANSHLRLAQLSQHCSPRLRKAGRCGRRPQGSSRTNPNAGTDTHRRIVCINGRSTGSSCRCPNGDEARRVGRNVYRCEAGQRSCPPGTKRVGRKCVGGTPPGGNNPPDRGHCIGGTMRHGACSCPPPSTPQSIGRNSYRCVVPPCPKGTKRSGRLCLPTATPDPQTPQCPPDTHRIGRRCGGDARPDPTPPGPVCRKGWQLRGGKCSRVIGSACPHGTRRDDGRCRRIPSTAIPGIPVPPPLAAPQPPAAAATLDDAPYEPGEILVEIASATAQQVSSRLIGTYSLTTLSRTQLNMLGTSLYRFRIPASREVEAVAADIAREPGVETSQPNWRYSLNQRQPTVLINDDGGATPQQVTEPKSVAAASPAEALPQFALDMIDARKALNVSRGANVLIAIIDTGIEETHPELTGTVAARFNAFPSQPFVPDTHATAIAGIVAAQRNLAGIAPDARILAVQAFTPTGKGDKGNKVAADAMDSGRGTSHRISVGLDWALMKGARVVNMSFAGPREDSLVARLIAKGDEAGVIYVAAAGNAGPKAPPAYPAAHPAVIAVTAIDEQRQLYSHANVGDYIALAAPGVDVMAPAAGNAYDLETGTSFAAAHVSAVAALVLSTSPAIGRERLLARLKSTAADLGPPGTDPEFGSGCVNALRAVTEQSIQAVGP